MKQILYILLLGLVAFTGCATKTPTVGKEPLIQTKIIIESSTSSDKSSVMASTLGGKGYDSGVFLTILSKNGFLLSGSTIGSFGKSRDISLVKLNSAGSADWLRTYGGRCSEIISGTIVSKEGDFLLTGYTNSLFLTTLSGCSNENKGLVLKVDRNGTVEWGKETHNLLLSELIQTKDGAYLLTGTTYTEKKRELVLMKIDQKGETIWQWRYGSLDPENNEGLRSVIELQDGGFMLFGVASGHNTAWYPGSVMLVRVSPDGELIWSRQLDGFNGTVVQTTKFQDGFAILGIDNNDGDDDIVVIRTDLEGNVAWANLYGGLYEERAYSLIEDSRGMLVVGGAINDTENYYGLDALLMGIGQRGELGYCLETESAVLSAVTEDKNGRLFVLGSALELDGGPTNMFFSPGQREAGGLWQDCKKTMKTKPMELQTRKTQLKGEKGDIKFRDIPTGNNVNGVIEREFHIERVDHLINIGEK